MRNICRMSGCLVQRSLHRIHLPFPPWLSDTWFQGGRMEPREIQVLFLTLEMSEWNLQNLKKIQIHSDNVASTFVASHMLRPHFIRTAGRWHLATRSWVSVVLLSGGWWVWNGERVKLHVSWCFMQIEQKRFLFWFGQEYVWSLKAKSTRIEGWGSRYSRG